jgi:hypothetical protein
VKNYFAIALTCVYLTLSVGVAKTTHYCMGRESSSQLFSFRAKPCVCEIWSKKTDSCCDDDHELIKIQSEQSQVAVLGLLAPEFFEVGALYTELFSAGDRVCVLTAAFEQALEDPPPTREPLFKMHCSFVFYEDDLAC